MFYVLVIFYLRFVDLYWLVRNLHLLRRDYTLDDSLRRAGTA